MKIPFVDLQAQYQTIKEEIDTAMSNVMKETAFVGGAGNKYVRIFEEEFSKYLGVKHTISCANGTDSIEILLEAFGVGAGDEVIIPALSWISTSEAVGRIGAKPVFVDVNPDTLLIDVLRIEEKITKNTKVIMPVHLYGNAVDMISIMDIATKHKLIVIEDCAQSHGAKFNGKLAGTFGHAASFSFYPGKNLGAYGDAGAITTDTEEIASKCRMIGNHGQLKKHTHVMEGRNSRMDGLHAAVLSVKLKHLDKWNSQRNANALSYREKINNKSIQLPVENKHAYHVYHLFVIRTEKRDELKASLEKNNVEVAVHYPVALPFVDAYKKYGYTPEDFPVSFAETKKILSIPMFPELSNEQINTVSDLVNAF
ncbi:erythromycin biosynthesis sensory transduction protein eryC1 [Sphingobacteriaceae bacterium]|nr:erythromycin biosynthesis sensory transduction protein eryC1 [Sphingobacteriaceae bacterium]